MRCGDGWGGGWSILGFDLKGCSRGRRRERRGCRGTWDPGEGWGNK